MARIVRLGAILAVTATLAMLTRAGCRPAPVDKGPLTFNRHVAPIVFALQGQGRIDFEEAVATARKAVRLARTGKRGAVADEIDSRLRLYQERQPYREP